MSFFTGKPSKESSSQTSTSTSSSQSGNQAFGILNNALAPALNYTSAGGNMIGALLGVPQGSSATTGSAVTPPPSAATSAVTPASPAPSYAPSTGYVAPQISRPYDSEHLPINGDPDTLFWRDQQANFGPTQGYTDGTPGTMPGSTAPAPGSVTPALTAPGAGSPVPTSAQAGSALDDFSNSAGMGFLRDQGVKAIESSQAGRGLLESGSTGKALSKFGNSLATTYLNDYLQHLTDYAKLGNDSAQTLASAGNYNNSQSQGDSTGTSSGTGAKKGMVDYATQLASSYLGAGGGQ
jgi:hypothetical protein